MCGGTLALLLIVGLSAYFSVSKLVETYQWTGHTQEILELLSSLGYSTTEIQTSSRGYLITGQTQYKDINAGAIIKTRELASRLQQSLTGQKKKCDELAESTEHVVGFYKNAMEAYDTKGYESAATLIRSGEGQRWMNTVKRQISDLVTVEKAHLAEHIASSTDSAEHTRLTIVAGTLLAVAFITLCGFLITMRITDPIRRLLRASDNMEKGRFDAVSVMNTNDEFEDLSLAFNQLGLSLQDSAQMLAKTKLDAEEAKTWLNAAREQVLRTAVKAEDLVVLSKEQSVSSEEQPIIMAGIVHSESELLKSASIISEVSGQVSEKLGSISRMQRSLYAEFQDLMNAITANSQRSEILTASIREASEKSVDLHDLSITMDGLCGDLNFLALNGDLQSSHSQDERAALSVFVERLRRLSEKAREDNLRIRQILARTEKSLSRSLALCDQPDLSASALARSHSSLAEGLLKLSGEFDGLKGLVAQVVDSTDSHASLHCGVPRGLDRLGSALGEQRKVSKISELRCDEMRASVSMLQQVLSGRAEACEATREPVESV
jgi:CHASE3 domain sensor protein